MVNNSIIKIVFCLMISTLLFSCKKNTENKIVLPTTNDGIESDISNETKIQNFDFLPTSTTNEIIKHEFYTLSYNENFEQAEWVAYELKSTNEVHNFKRPLFTEDNDVKTHSADWRNYKNSGYDKGHLCPAGDMKFNKKAYYDTFLTSNISPQTHEFNDGIWNTLEGKVRYWANKYDGIYVVTGGVLNSNLKTIGKEKVAVPQYFYKVLLNSYNGKYKMIGFLVPAQDSSKPLYEFVVPVNEIEKLTGLDFYPKLDDTIENLLESNSNYKEWSFN